MTSPRSVPFFELGFRPFFLGAAVFAPVAVLLWILALRSDLELAFRYDAQSWHVHEMLFGYGSAVLTGFLLTAVPNWTNRPPLIGGALIALFAVWVLGRVAMITPLPPLVAIACDGLFLPMVLGVMAREVIAGRNWRNMAVLIPVSLFTLANVGFHFETLTEGYAATTIRLGFAALIFLLMLIGGRITPAFTRNWMIQKGVEPKPPMMNRFDGVCLVSGLISLLAWVFLPEWAGTGVVLLLSATLHLMRLARWGGWRTRVNPILFALHVYYAMIPVGLAAVALGVFDPAYATAGLHVIGIGAIGGMTLAVMMRASMGHTGRPLVSDRWLTLALACIIAAVLSRFLWASFPDFDWMLDLAALFWIAAFGLFIIRIGPWMFKPRLS
jgi:uncharacterized protein involved in response to NO